MVNPQRKRLVKSIAARPVGRPSLVWTIWRPINASTLGWNHTNVPAATNGFKRNQIWTNIWKRTTRELPNALSLVVYVAKLSTTSHLTTLMFVPRIQLHSPLPLTGNDLPLKTQTRLLQKNLRGRTKQVREQRQNNQLPLKHLLPVPVGKRIPCLFPPTLFLLQNRI